MSEKSLKEKLSSSKAYRESFVASVLKRALPAQLRRLRKQRGWTQEELASKANLTQGAISRAEDPDYGNLSINNLLRIGGGLDVAFVGRFVPFSELARWFSELSEQNMEVDSFENDTNWEDSPLLPATVHGGRYHSTVGMDSSTDKRSGIIYTPDTSSTKLPLLGVNDGT